MAELRRRRNRDLRVDVQPPLRQKLGHRLRLQVGVHLVEEKVGRTDIRRRSHDLGAGVATVDDQVGRASCRERVYARV